MSGSSDGIVNTNAGVIAEGKIYGRFQYIINLHAKETALVGLINKMSSHGLFITIKSIQMKKTGPDVRDRSSSAMPVYGGPGAIMPGPGHPILPRGGPGGSDEEEKASGFSIEPPMEISLLLDVYVFKISEGGSQN